MTISVWLVIKVSHDLKSDPQEHAVVVRERVLAEEHPNRLTSQHDLAVAYRADDRWARSRLKHVVAVRKKALVEEHPSRLASQHALGGVSHIWLQMVPNCLAT